MKIIISAIKYLFNNFIALSLFSLPLAIFFAVKYNDSNFYDYLLNISTVGTSTLKIYSHFSILPSFNILMILLWSVLLICCLCLLFSFVERHMKYGIKSYIKTFKSINYCVLVLIPAFLTVVLMAEFFSFLISLIINLLSLSQSSLIGMIIILIYIFLMVILFLIYSVVSLWIPIKMVTGYTNRDSIRYSIRLTQGNQFKIMAGLIFPILITAPVMIVLKQLSDIEFLNTAVYVLCYIFIFSYLPSYMMTAYFKISGTERKDIKKKIF